MFIVTIVMVTVQGCSNVTLYVYATSHNITFRVKKNKTGIYEHAYNVTIKMVTMNILTLLP